MNSTLTPIENHVIKALEMLNREFTKDKTYYSEAIKQLSRISDISRQISEAVQTRINTNGSRTDSKISQLEITESDSTASKLSEITELLKSMYNCMCQQNMNTELTVSDSSSQDSIDVETPIVSDISADKKMTYEFVSPELFKKIMRTYDRQLHNARLQTTGNHVLDTITQLISEWFKIKFRTKKHLGISIKFHVAQIPELVYAIVIYLGYQLECGNFDQAVMEFDRWLENSVKYPESTGQFLVPPDVYSIYTEECSEYATVSAALIWYKLTEIKYLDLIQTKIEGCDNCFITFDGLFDKISRMNDPLLDIFGEAKDDPECYKQYGIV